MSEYAEIVNGEVRRVLVIDDNWSEAQAQSFLMGVSPHTWIKTNKKVGKTFEYHADKGFFTRPKPFSSWVLDDKREMYRPPIVKPLSIAVGYVWKWNEELQQWVRTRIKKI